MGNEFMEPNLGIMYLSSGLDSRPVALQCLYASAPSFSRPRLYRDLFWLALKHVYSVSGLINTCYLIRPASVATICNARTREYILHNARLPPMNQKLGCPLCRHIYCSHSSAILSS